MTRKIIIKWALPGLRTALGVAVFGLGLVVVAAEPVANRDEVIDEILNTLRYTQQALQGLSARMEFMDVYAPGTLGPDQLETQHRKESVHYVLSSDGRTRMEIKRVRVDDRGKPVEEPHRTVQVWGSEYGATLTERGEHRTVQLHHDQASAQLGRKPEDYLRAFGRSIPGAIERAQTQGWRLEVERDPAVGDKVYVLTVATDPEADVVLRLWLDSSKLYYPLRMEEHRNGRLVCVRSSVPQNAAADIWLPRSGQLQFFVYREGSRQTRVDTKLLVTELKVNQESYPAELFEVKIRQDDAVVDVRSGTPIRYGGKSEIKKLNQLFDISAAAMRDEFKEKSKTVVTSQTVAGLALSNTTAAPSPPKPEKNLERAAEPGALRSTALWLGAGGLILALAGLILTLRHVRAKPE